MRISEFDVARFWSSYEIIAPLLDESAALADADFAKVRRRIDVVAPVVNWDTAPRFTGEMRVLTRLRHYTAAWLHCSDVVLRIKPVLLTNAVPTGNAPIIGQCQKVVVFAVSLSVDGVIEHRCCPATELHAECLADCIGHAPGVVHDLVLQRGVDRPWRIRAMRAKAVILQRVMPKHDPATVVAICSYH